MKRKRMILLGLAGLAILAIVYLYGGSTVPEGQSPLLYLNNSNVASLQNEFNKSGNSVRLLVLLSPT
jgi:hypothetical protein